MKKYIVLIVTVLIVFISVLLLGSVNVNYDMKEYLPKDHVLVEGIDLHNDLYGESSYTHVFIQHEDLHDVFILKESLLTIEHVSDIDFIDRVLNEMTYGLWISQLDETSQNMINTELMSLMGQGLSFAESFYQIVNEVPDIMVQDLKQEIRRYTQQDAYKMTIQLDLEASSTVVETVVSEIKQKISDQEINGVLVGGVMSDLFVRDAIESEVLKITIILIPLVLVILLLMTPSFADLIVFIVISGVAIIVNLGTNAIFPHISFITQSMAIALQLAISLDYMIFIVHRYHKERIQEDTDLAMKKTMKHVASPVIASALTTAVSFLALVFMRFTIGADIGLVFLKAVILSALSALILGPILMKWLDRWMVKSKHRIFIPKFSVFSKIVYHLRYVFLGLFILLIIPAYYFQSHNTFIYGESSLIGSAGSSYDDDLSEMVDLFGHDNQLVIITEQNAMKEAVLYQRLLSEDLPINYIHSAIPYQSLPIDPNVLAILQQSFYQQGYQRMMISLDMKEEGEVSEKVINDIEDILKDIGFDQVYIIGSTPAALSIKDVIETDYFYVTLIALALIMFVIFVTFKNWILPVILPLVIMTSVFLAMSVPYFIGHPLAFLGYLVVSTILLGATIDYAILFTKRYIELRENFDVHLSIEKAIEDSAPSITTSALIFGIAGLSLSFISSVLAIQQIGLQIALGALFGLLSVLVLLPQLILIFDKLITRSKVKLK